MGDITTLVSTMGFPIVACFAMAWYVKYQTDSYRSEVTSMRKEHQSEIEKVTTALNNNTLALQKLCDKLSKED